VPESAGSPAIEIVDLAKSYDAVRALDRVSLTVRRGEVFGYLGPNGAGKTTTIKLLTGLIRPTSGDARIGGFSVVEHPLEVKARIGYVPESGAIYEKLTPREYLTITGELYGMSDPVIEAKVRELLEMFGLLERIDERMETFSKGMKQKVCLASALIHGPEILFLDEPMNGLDVDAVMLMKDLIQRLSRAGATIFYTSHLIDLVEKICTRIGVLDRGRLIAAGTVGELLERTGAPSLELALMKLWGRPTP
jgi:ABC-2 type transport system ATP-binding protein